MHIEASLNKWNRLDLCEFLSVTSQRDPFSKVVPTRRSKEWTVYHFLDAALLLENIWERQRSV